MRHLALAIAFSTFSTTTVLGQGAGNPDIFLLSLTVRDGTIWLGKPLNITNRVGYDNQPSFSPDSRAIYYTSTRDDAQSDIYKYTIESKKTERLTTTAPESEYSATVMPSKERISVIRVEKDSTQRLWSFALKGGDDRVVLRDIKPVGYHAWIDPFHLALFVLGTPNSLVIADTRSGATQVVARDSADRSFRCRTDTGSLFYRTTNRIGCSPKSGSVGETIPFD